MTARTKIMALALGALLALPAPSARAGLDLQNQAELRIADLDLNRDGRIRREEMAEYMFFFFDRDGNETLTNGEYHKDRTIAVLPYDGDAITMIDLDNDGNDDGVSYDTGSFLGAVMVGDYDPEDGTISARTFTDVYFMRLDSDKSGAVELDEWHKSYEKHAILKPNQAPKAASNDGYNN